MINILTKPATIWFIGAIVLFVVGYGSYLIFGADQTLEEISELLLKKWYKIDVEFSN